MHGNSNTKVHNNIQLFLQLVLEKLFSVTYRLNFCILRWTTVFYISINSKLNMLLRTPCKTSFILNTDGTTSRRNKDVRNGCISGLRALGVGSAKGLWGGGGGSRSAVYHQRSKVIGPIIQWHIENVKRQRISFGKMTSVPVIWLP